MVSVLEYKMESDSEQGGRLQRSVVERGSTEGGKIDGPPKEEMLRRCEVYGTLSGVELQA